MSASASFVREAHRHVCDLLQPRLRRYWTDFLLTIGLAYAAFAVYVAAVPFSPLQIAAFLVCGLAMYRAVIFTHEITHRRNAAFHRFAFVWNLLCGIPFLMPSFMYGNHQGHHSSDAYGTWTDPEYIMRGPRWRLKAVAFLMLPALYPFLVVIRFLVFTPLAMMSDGMNRIVWKYGSSLYVMNESYRREYSPAASAPSRWIQEIACCAWAWLGIGAAFAGRVPWSLLGKTYLVFLFWIAVNQVRTLAAHRYRNNVNAPVSYLDQLLDTNTFPQGRWLPELWAPVGLRYHALHHLLPLMPYHSMAAAHQRLLQRLPPDSPYHQTIRPGLWSVLRSLLLDADGGAAGAPRSLPPRAGLRGAR